jgi:hypothetical protein
MPISPTKVFVVALAAAFAAAAIHPAMARDKKSAGDTVPDIMIDEGGKPLKKKKRGAPKVFPRGSSYIPSMTLPRTVAPTVGEPSPGVYRPPPINSFSDRVTNCNHSFPLNAGIGNNPTDRSAYVRQCAN